MTQLKLGMKLGICLVIAVAAASVCAQTVPLSRVQWTAESAPRPRDEAPATRDASGHCRLLASGELLDWLDSPAAPAGLPSGFYWIRPNSDSVSDKESRYALYLHWPSRQVVEYGSLMFDAHLVERCAVQSGQPAAAPRR